MLSTVDAVGDGEHIQDHLRVDRGSTRSGRWRVIVAEGMGPVLDQLRVHPEVGLQASRVGEEGPAQQVQQWRDRD